MALYRGVCLLILVVGLAGISLAAPSSIMRPAFGQDSPQSRQPLRFPDTQYEPVDWDNLDGWDKDDHEAAFAAYLTSCRALNVRSRRSNARAAQNVQLTGIAAALRDVCERAQSAIPL